MSRSASEPYGGTEVALADIEIGTPVPTLQRRVSRLRINAYCAAVRFLHQVHFDDELCQRQGWDGVIVPGFLMGNWCIEASSRMVGPTSVVRKTDFRMTSVAYPDADLTVSGEVTDVVRSPDEIVVTCAVEVADEKGQIVTRGNVTVAARVESES